MSSVIFWFVTSFNIQYDQQYNEASQPRRPKLIKLTIRILKSDSKILKIIDRDCTNEDYEAST
jgi:hypothetical protein